MYFERFYHQGLAQASYLVGCQRTGEAIVIDPNRDIAQYVAAAKKNAVRITHVTETHIHADFVSGARELAAATGARLFLSDEGDADWKYAFASHDGATLLHDGDHIMVGNIRLDVMHTPGHTPEHVVFVVTDTPAAAGPWGIISGDFVFVGDVGRPDLLERAAGVSGSMDAAAHTLFKSLERFRALPDHLQLWPGHGAGSACGKALGAVPSSTVGYERIANWGVGTTDEGEFVRMVLTGQPEPPRYFATMKRVNKEGPALLAGRPRSGSIDARDVVRLVEGGALIVDVRPGAAFLAGHLPGAIGIPRGNSFLTWAGSVLPYDRELHLLLPDTSASAVDTIVRELALVGLDRIAGVLGTDALEAWSSSGRSLATIASTTPREAAAMLARGAAMLIDVRGQSEWESGHVDGALHLPLGQVAARVASLEAGRPGEMPLIVQCQSGTRSVIASSLLEAQGRTNVLNLVGGIEGWMRDGLPVTHEPSEVVAGA